MTIHKGILKGELRGVGISLNGTLACDDCKENLSKLNTNRLTIAKGLIDKVLDDLK